MLLKAEENKENILVELPAQMCLWHSKCCIFKMKLFVLVGFIFWFCSFIVEAKLYWLSTFLFYFLFLPYFQLSLSFTAHILFFLCLFFLILCSSGPWEGNVCQCVNRNIMQKKRNFQGTSFLTHLCQLPSTPVFFSRKWGIVYCGLF